MPDLTVVFTSTNTSITINNNQLDCVQTIDVEDAINSYGDKYTNITLTRLASDNDHIINDIRSAPFVFKVFNSATGGGYISQKSEVVAFKMHLAAKKDDSYLEFLEQVIVIKAKSFVYGSDIRSDEMKIEENKDLVNLIDIINENKAKVINRLSTVECVNDTIPIDNKDLVWLNAKDPEQLNEVTPRKLKKSLKKK